MKGSSIAPAGRLFPLGLGTVQWGIPYGIANVSGRPDYKEVDAMLRIAVETGINLLDTARAYGESEHVIGDLVLDSGLADRFAVVTKVRYEGGDPVEAATTSLRQSLAMLRLPRVPFLLLHNAEAISLPTAWEGLLAQRDRGLAERIGVSISAAPIETLSMALTLEAMSAVQIALNVFDTQLVTSGMLRELHARGVTVFVRSAFLQGLIALPPEQVPQALSEVLPAKKRLHELAARSGRDLMELALQFPLSLDEVDCVLVGCEKSEQLRQNIAWAAANPLSSDERAEVTSIASDLPAWIAQPWLWPT